MFQGQFRAYLRLGVLEVSLTQYIAHRGGGSRFPNHFPYIKSLFNMGGNTDSIFAFSGRQGARRDVFFKYKIRPPLAIFEKKSNDKIKCKIFKFCTKWTGLM